VKTFDFDLDDGGIYPLGGIVVEFQLLSVVPCLRWRVWFFLVFFVYL
jgi:hypothetical protein